MKFQGKKVKKCELKRDPDKEVGNKMETSDG